MNTVVMTGRPEPHEVVAILMVLRARPSLAPEPPVAPRRPVRLPVAGYLHSPRSWRLAPARTR